jgi:HTH-type transcriptional regulator / antitoxin HipB
MDYPVRTPDQLTTLLQAFRKEAGMTQTEAAQRLGVKQQTISALERNAETVSAERLLRLLNVLGVELVMRKATAGNVAQDSKSQPTW